MSIYSVYADEYATRKNSSVLQKLKLHIVEMDCFLLVQQVYITNRELKETCYGNRQLVSKIKEETAGQTGT